MSERDGWSQRPDWFTGLWTTVLQFLPAHQEFAQGALGIGRLIDVGQLEEARRLYEQLNPSILLTLSMQDPCWRTSFSTPGSTLLDVMLKDPKYPNDLKQELMTYLSKR